MADPVARPARAEGTALGTGWERRPLPGEKKPASFPGGLFY